MERSSVWDLSRQCDSSIATVVFQMVNLGVWSPDARVDNSIAETICTLLKDPSAGRRKVATSDVVDERAVAEALLQTRAYERPVTHAEIAAATGSSVDEVLPIVQQMEAASLLVTRPNGTIVVAPAKARPLSAIAEGQVTVQNVAS